ncbi:MAG: hypothetical protein HYS86_01820 [Candidatus Chisholmbacteria bacterium]|nr:hypothetical protein [Candidatus Chisholmbacteria bacterium]
MSVRTAAAQAVPTFPACGSPQGDVKVSYSEGTHGIVGDTATYTGSDAVYTLTDTTLTQCFCTEDASRGIQTNWWKVSSLTEQEIEVLRREGWSFVPNGALWGLGSEPYLAKNSDFACEGGQGGSVLGASTNGKVLGLATTGSMPLIVGLIALGVVLLVMALKLRRSA